MTCKECIHYEACKVLIDGANRMIQTLNRGFNLKGADKVPTYEFPMDDSCGCMICFNQAHRDRFVELPCKVGDMVYVPWRWGGQRAVATVKIEEIKFYDSQMHYMFLIDMESDNECFNQSFGGWKTDRCIGKTVFLTREEAEKALKERSENNG